MSILRFRDASIRPFRRTFERLRASRGKNNDVWGTQDKPVLENVNWEVKKGEQWLVRGDNGSGKSTLIAAIAGRALVTRGDMRISENATMKYVSFEHQRDFLAREADLESVSQSIGLHYQPNAAIDPETAPQAWKIAERLGLPISAAKRGLGTLSTGELNKVMLSRALGASPDILLLDEVENGLDIAARRHFREILSEIIHDTHVILVSHHHEAIPEVITDILTISDGMLSVEPRNSVHQAKSVTPSVPKTVLESKKTEGELIVEMKQLTVSYGERKVLDGLDWSVREGEHWAIIGPNGSGKSTLLDIVCATHPQIFSNNVQIFGRSCRRTNANSKFTSRLEISRDIGTVNPKLQMRFNTREDVRNVVLSGFFDTIGLFNECTEEQIEKANNALELIGMSNLSSVSYATLSLGQQMKVLIARAMVKRPRLLILDEPCSALDAQSREGLLSTIDALASSQNSANDPLTTVLYVTHHSHLVPQCITRTLQLERTV